MKTKLLLLLMVIVIALSCTKTKVNNVTKTITDTTTLKDTTTFIDTPFETPFKSLYTKGLIIDTLDFEGGSYEIGTQFYTAANGKISKLGCIAPIKNQAVTVSLWDAVQDTLITSANVTCTDTLHFFYTNITPVNVTANTPYMVSMNTAGGTFYLIINQTFSNLPFPFSDGSVTLVNSYFAFSATPAFPSTSESDYVSPVDFVFKAN